MTDTAVRTDAPPPRLADGIELVGRFEDSGFKEPPYIARRADGQVIQLPEMLYRLAELVDGSRDPEQIGEELSEATGRGVDGDAVSFLIDEKLRPLGVVAAADGSSPQLQKLDPLLALRFKAGVVPEHVTNAITVWLRPLFAAPVVVAVVAGLVALDVWLFGFHGIAAATREVLYNPALLVGLLGAVVLATAWHELGHATACRYGGARPGKMGAGIYIIWPVFYTDVTDAYRLDRAGRLRTDLGGIYFNAIFALATAGLYLATRYEPLLLVVLLQNFAMIQQLLPFIRLDGYYVISDLTGVPDMFSRIRPTLRSLLPGRPMDDRVAELKPRARRVVVAYVAFLVPLVLGIVVLLVLQAPRIFATAYDSFGLRVDEVGEAFGDGAVLAGVGGLLQVGALLVPAIGIALTTSRIAGRVGRGAWSWSAGSPPRRAGVVAVTGALAALAAFTWWPNGEYRPIQPEERGTLAGAVDSLAAVPTGRPALTEERRRELGGAPTESERRSREPAGAEPEPPATEPESGPREDGPEGEATPTPTPTPQSEPTPTPTPTPQSQATPTPTPQSQATPEPTP